MTKLRARRIWFWQRRRYMAEGWGVQWGWTCDLYGYLFEWPFSWIRPLAQKRIA